MQPRRCPEWGRSTSCHGAQGPSCCLSGTREAPRGRGGRGAGGRAAGRTCSSDRGTDRGPGAAPCSSARKSAAARELAEAWKWPRWPLRWVSECSLEQQLSISGKTSSVERRAGGGRSGLLSVGVLRALAVRDGAEQSLLAEFRVLGAQVSATSCDPHSAESGKPQAALTAGGGGGGALQRRQRLRAGQWPRCHR